jgi:periplasmic protein CpxP/Spy
MKKFLYGLLTLAILIGSGYAVAAGPIGPGGPGGPGGPHGPDGMLGMVLTLGLTDAQKHDVAVILKKSRADFDRDVEAMREALKAIHDVMRNDPGNEQLVRQASRKIASAGEELAVLRGKVSAEIKALLSKEQLKRLEEQAPPPPDASKPPVPPMRVLVDEWIDAHAGPAK